MAISFEQIRRAFPDGHMQGREWITMCPAHGDTGKGAPNLSITVDGDLLLAHCNRGCPQESVFRAVCEKIKAHGGEAPANPEPLPAPAAAEEWTWNTARLDTAARALQHNKPAQEFLATRGISLEQAQAMRFGVVGAWTAPDGKEFPTRIVMPTFVAGELAAVKLRAFGKYEPADKWRKRRRESGAYWLFNRDVAALADELFVVESELDAAMLTSLGHAAVSVDSAGHKLTASDKALLKNAGRVILALDTDEAGQECAKRIEAVIPAARRLRIVPHTKDLGELYSEAPDRFAARLAKLVRFAATTRVAFSWDDLLLEDEIIDQQGLELKYAVDKLIPLQRITMLYGPEKSCKSLLALYLCKCAANGLHVLDNYSARKMPTLYLDAEDGILGEYIGWMRGLGPEKVRFRTLKSGIPALDDPYLLDICRKQKPLLVVDSLHKFTGTAKTNAWRASDMEPVLQKLRDLCVAGATVILIHHSTKADEEMYRDSNAIGAGVDFLFAVVGSDPDAEGVKRVRVVGKPSRGAQPPTLNLIAFPHLIKLGKFTLEAQPPKTDVDLAVEYVASIPLGATKRAIREGLKGMSSARKDAALDEAVKQGRLEVNSKGIYSVPRGGAQNAELGTVPQSGHSSGTGEQEMPF